MISSKAKVGNLEVIVSLGTLHNNPENSSEYLAFETNKTWIKYEGTWYKSTSKESVVSILRYLRGSSSEEDLLERVLQII